MNKIKQIPGPLWHPCSQMKDYETFPPLHIQTAKGSTLFLQDGTPILDAISSWWCKSLGHGHPRLKKALLQQMERFEHVILANTTHDTIVKLSERLAALTQTLDKIFYASEGSSAIEIALKMSLHAHALQGNPERTTFIALENGYHGETTGALSVSDLGLYRTPYEPMLFQSVFLRGIPYVHSEADPLWTDCSSHWPQIEAQLAPYAATASALLVEPMLQGAGGMRVYSQDFLVRLRDWTKEHTVHLIADEIMTGLGRTGLPLACQHANIEPDFLCLSKGLTAGWLPMSVVCTSTEIYSLFYDDYETGKAFLHSHTHSGNALAAAVALEVLQILDEEQIYPRAQALGKEMRALMQELQDSTGKIHHIRSLGALVAADLVVDDPNTRRGYQVFQRAVQLGALLRPLGNTLYWMPPLTTEIAALHQLQEITRKAIG